MRKLALVVWDVQPVCGPDRPLVAARLAGLGARMSTELRTAIWHLAAPSQMDVHLCTRHLGEMRMLRQDNEQWEITGGACWACQMPGWTVDG